jgi:hypothetical protein
MRKTKNGAVKKVPKKEKKLEKTISFSKPTFLGSPIAFGMT